MINDKCRVLNLIFRKAWEEMGIFSLLQDFQLSCSDGHALTHKEENEKNRAKNELM